MSRAEIIYGPDPRFVHAARHGNHGDTGLSWPILMGSHPAFYCAAIVALIVAA